MPEPPSTENVVYLPEHGASPTELERSGPPGVGIAEYDRSRAPHEAPREREEPDQPERAGPAPPPAAPIRPLGVDPSDVQQAYARLQAAQVEAALPAFGSHGPTPQPHELVPPPVDHDNPFGDFFGDGPSAWLEDDDSNDPFERGQPRVVGTMLAAGAVTMLCAAWAVWGVAIERGAGGAEAGGFVLLSMLMWIWYLSMPRTQQHSFMLRRHARLRDLVERRTTPLRERTEGQMSMRRERDRYRAMRDERTRRINALGEGAYRSFRQGQLPADLHAGAQRVLLMERQMLSQDQRIHQMDARRRGGEDPPPVADTASNPGTDPAGHPPQGGHPTT